MRLDHFPTFYTNVPRICTCPRRKHVVQLCLHRKMVMSPFPPCSHFPFHLWPSYTPHPSMSQVPHLQGGGSEIALLSPQLAASWINSMLQTLTSWCLACYLSGQGNWFGNTGGWKFKAKVWTGLCSQNFREESFLASSLPRGSSAVLGPPWPGDAPLQSLPLFYSILPCQHFRSFSL